MLILAKLITWILAKLTYVDFSKVKVLSKSIQYLFKAKRKHVFAYNIIND